MYIIDTYWPQQLIFFVCPYTMTFFFRDLACGFNFWSYMVYEYEQIDAPTWAVGIYARPQVTEGLSHAYQFAKLHRQQITMRRKKSGIDKNKMKVEEDRG
jgi:hypothetical protein